MMKGLPPAPAAPPSPTPEPNPTGPQGPPRSEVPSEYPRYRTERICVPEDRS